MEELVSNLFCILLVIILVGIILCVLGAVIYVAFIICTEIVDEIKNYINK